MEITKLLVEVQSRRKSTNKGFSTQEYSALSPYPCYKRKKQFSWVAWPKQLFLLVSWKFRAFYRGFRGPFKAVLRPRLFTLENLIKALYIKGSRGVSVGDWPDVRLSIVWTLNCGPCCPRGFHPGNFSNSNYCSILKKWLINFWLQHNRLHSAHVHASDAMSVELLPSVCLQAVSRDLDIRTYALW